MLADRVMHALDNKEISAIHERFAADHHRLEVLLAELIAAIDACDEEGTQLTWARFRTALTNHLDIEETHMLPALRLTSERNARVLLEEHRHIRRRLGELDIAIHSHLVSLQAVRDFLDELRAHTQSEDRLIYGDTPH